MLTSMKLVGPQLLDQPEKAPITFILRYLEANCGIYNVTIAFAELVRASLKHCKTAKIPDVCREGQWYAHDDLRRS